MEKVICDVCGIAYPETASQCPICGCARTDNAQTSACDTVQVDEENAYAATKGGRFSKNNVRKRLKAQQIQPVPLEIPPRASKKEEAVYDEDEDYEEYDQDDDDDMPASNKGLVIVVVLLLLAIIAVSSYIAIVHFDIFGSNKPSQGVKDPVLSTTAPTNAPDPTDPSGPADPTDPTGPSDPVVKIPCTNVQADATLTLGKDLSTMQLSYSVEPVDTTDDVKFTSNNPAVATVDTKGRVTAVSTGEATIFITCGSITKECVVTCYMDDEPDVPDEPMPDLKLRMTDATFNAKGYQWRAFERTEGFDETKFTWTMDDETIATVDNGFVTTVAPGRTTLRVYYKGEQVASCIIRCNWTEEPEVPEDPDDPVDPPAEVKYEIKINNVNPAYKYNNQDNTAEVSQAVGHKFKLTLVDKELTQIMNDVVWTLSDETVCKLDGNNVVGLKKGTCKITCEYDGVTYLVFVRVTN